jgi:NADH dehydrogenase
MDVRRGPRVVIVGGGFGGLWAARGLKGSGLQATLVDRRNHHLFQPLLYQVATAGLSPSDIAYPIRAVVRRYPNVRVELAEAIAVDVAAHEVVLRDMRLGYDFLILAAGMRNSYFGHPDWEANAPGLKSLEEALEIRRRILLAFEKAERESDAERRRALLTFVIIGGGPTGVELAGAIAEISRSVIVSDFRAIDPRQARVVLLEAGPRILPSFPAELSAKARAALEKRQVEVGTGAPVSTVGPASVTIGAKRIEAHTIVWAAGVAASPIARSLGVPLDRAGRVLVEPDLTVPGHPEIFVIGDLAALEDQTGKLIPGLAPAAMQMGRHAARNIIRASRGQPRENFRYFDKGSLATIGRAAGVADLGWIRVSGFFAWVLWLAVHIFFLIGFRNRVLVMLEWAWAYFANQRGARLITGDMFRDDSAHAAAPDASPAQTKSANAGRAPQFGAKK